MRTSDFYSFFSSPIEILEPQTFEKLFSLKQVGMDEKSKTMFEVFFLALKYGYFT